MDKRIEEEERKGAEERNNDLGGGWFSRKPSAAPLLWIRAVSDWGQTVLGNISMSLAAVEGWILEVALHDARGTFGGLDVCMALLLNGIDAFCVYLGLFLMSQLTGGWWAGLGLCWPTFLVGGQFVYVFLNVSSLCVWGSLMWNDNKTCVSFCLFCHFAAPHWSA